MNSGQCLCGSVSFTAQEIEPQINACHCRMCQRWSGGVFLTSTARGLQFVGEQNIERHRSSDWAERGFCSECGTHIFYRMLRSDAYALCVGTIDDLTGFTMDEEIFMDRKPAAYAFAGDHERLTDAETMQKYKGFDS